MRSISKAALAVAGLFSALSSPGLAQDRGVAFGGGETGDDRSGYFGVTWALPGARLGEGWAVRGLASAGRYDYDGATDWIEAEFVQADVVLLRQSSGDWGYFNLGAGARFTDTDLTPDDPGNEREGGHWDGVVTADGMATGGGWRAGGYAVYGVRMQEYFVRGEVTRALGAGPFRVGVEVLADGDENYSRQGAGVVGAYETAAGFSVRAAVGQRGDDDDTYVSLGLTRTF